MTGCVLCGRDLTVGHVCDRCLTRLGERLDRITADVAAASVEPQPGRGGTGRTVPASKPPVDLDGCAPALVLVDLGHAKVPLLEVLESWERLVREERRLAPYGLASAQRVADGRTPSPGYQHTTVLLVASTAFLRASLEWWSTRPDLPLDQLEEEVRACERAARVLQRDRDRPAYGIPCPGMRTDGSDCGWVIPVRRVDPEERAACRRCGRIWDTDRLLVVAGETADAWVDPEAAAVWAGVPERTVRHWGAKGWVRRQHGMYLLADVQRHAETKKGPPEVA